MIGLENFVLRQFNNPNYIGTQINYDTEKFIKEINEKVEKSKENKENLLKEGYAPFCKHIFIENFVGAQVGAIEINESNSHLLKTDYLARTDKELPVLVRWFPKEKLEEIPQAKFLDLILYSKEQVKSENISMGVEMNNDFDSFEWFVVAIKAQNEDFELPMSPITMMRNSLGKDEGGSGIKLSREKYLDSVKYWKNHAIIN
ncbi:hypothetical protein M0811_09310 [Anaeramoeba ignava]|uniref:Uncharacterized protein n=1 Tax=Anaeramoeba ignava TaxID=1746090 RepID=A0A9Q0RAA0_ANAIG|nr:hypothetical protein M0811_09310 [Anaeramoeba ignava]